MPTLNWIGKDKVVNHHRDVPFKILEHQYGFSAEKGKQENPTDSGNKIIHGDNLEALKALLPEYEGKIKCIYIDPPYNTGNENWVYNDNVNHPKIKKWLGEVVGKEGDDLTRHDKWLCMMYPRLKLLQKLLSENGVIFISIDDNEQANLKLLCDEIFGKNNFLSQLIWNSEGNTDNQLEVKINHEYILMYTKKNQNKSKSIGYVIDPNTREDSNLWKGLVDNNINKNSPANPPDLIELPIGFPSSEETIFYSKKILDDAFFVTTKLEKFISDSIKEKYKIEDKSGLPVKIDDLVVKDYKLVKPCKIYGGFANGKKLKAFIENGCQPIMDGDSPISFYLNANSAVRYKKEVQYSRNILSVLRNFGTTEKMRTTLKNMGFNFTYPKPVDLIKHLICIGAFDKDSIVLDSFAGSGTTAHAVLNLNVEDGGNRKFILIEMEDYAKTITAERVKLVIEGKSGNSKRGEIIETSFDYYELGLPLFDEHQNLNEEVPTPKIREYIWYSETRSAFVEPKSNTDTEFLLGSKDRTVYYFVYDKNALTTLDYDLLSTIKTKGEQYVIYADNCLLSKEFMAKNNIIFKKIPRDISRF